jgi:hypothetical protein
MKKARSKREVRGRVLRANIRVSYQVTPHGQGGIDARERSDPFLMRRRGWSRLDDGEPEALHHPNLPLARRRGACRARKRLQ